MKLRARVHACCPSADASLWFDRGLDREIEPSAARYRRIEYTSIRTNPDSISQQAGETGHRRPSRQPDVRMTRGNRAYTSKNLDLREPGLSMSHAPRPDGKTASQRMRPGLFYGQRSQKTLRFALPSVSVCLHEGFGRRDENASIRVTAYMAHSEVSQGIWTTGMPHDRHMRASDPGETIRRSVAMRDHPPFHVQDASSESVKTPI